MNRRRRINTASVFKGITWDKRASKWIAQIKVEGKHLHLGTFETEELAHAAYCEAATRHFGEFARFS
jgi:hypothetical protein